MTTTTNHTCIDSTNTPTGLFCVACVEGRDYTGNFQRQKIAKYPARILGELLAAGEISRDQYERLRRESVPEPLSPQPAPNPDRCAYYDSHTQMGCNRRRDRHQYADHDFAEARKSDQTATTLADQWSIFAHYPKRILDQTGVVVAEAQSEELAEKIVADRESVSRLVGALKEAMKVVSDRAAGGRMLTTQKEAGDVWGRCAKAIFDSRATLYAGE